MGAGPLLGLLCGFFWVFVDQLLLFCIEFFVPRSSIQIAPTFNYNKYAYDKNHFGDHTWSLKSTLDTKKDRLTINY